MKNTKVVKNVLSIIKEQYKNYNSRLPSRPSSPLSSCSYVCPIASLLGAKTAPIINK